MTTRGQDPTPTPRERDELDFERTWATYLHTREWVREVLSDDDLRAFGINLDLFDRKPEAGDFP